MLPRSLIGGWLLLALSCVEVLSIEAPPLPSSTRSVLELRGGGDEGPVRAWAHSREGFESAGLSPVIGRSAGRAPTVWLEYLDATLEELELESGELTLAPADRCGARPLPSGAFRYKLEMNSGEWGFAPAPEGSSPPAAHVEGICPCPPNVELRAINLDGICRPKAVFVGPGRLVITGRADSNCASGPLTEGRRWLVDLPSGAIVRTSTLSTFVTELFSNDGETLYLGNEFGRIFRARNEDPPELIYEPPTPHKRVRKIHGGRLSDGSLELLFAIEPKEVEPSERSGSPMLVRYRVRDGQATVIAPSTPPGVNTRQRVVLFWMNPRRYVMFPDDEGYWLDVEGDQVRQRAWTGQGPVRAGTFIPGRGAVVASYASHLFELADDQPDWRRLPGSESQLDFDVNAMTSRGPREEWFYLESNQVAHRVDGYLCPLVSSPATLRSGSDMHGLGSEIVVIGERLDTRGSAIIHYAPE